MKHILSSNPELGQNSRQNRAIPLLTHMQLHFYLKICAYVCMMLIYFWTNRFSMPCNGYNYRGLCLVAYSQVLNLLSKQNYLCSKSIIIGIINWSYLLKIEKLLLLMLCVIFLPFNRFFKMLLKLKLADSLSNAKALQYLSNMRL